MKTKICIIMILSILLLVGCGETTAPLAAAPTLAMLPTLPSDTPTSPATPTTTATATDPPATASAEATTPETPPTITPSATITDTVTPTPTPSYTPSWTPIPSDTPSAVGGLLAVAVSYTPPPQPTGSWPRSAVGGTPASGGAITTPSTCLNLPPGGFGSVYSSDPLLAGQLGCPIGSPPITTAPQTAVQTFERGLMIWVQATPGSIYVLKSDGNFERYDDTWVDGVDPVSGNMTAPPGLTEPMRGFGKVWRNNSTVQSGLGWATAGEQGGTATLGEFERGRMLALPQRNEIIVLVFTGGANVGTWRAVPGGF